MFRRRCKQECEENKNKEEKVDNESTNTKSDQDSQSGHIQTSDAVCQLLEACNTELEETKEKLARVGADLLNYQRRVEKEKLQWIHIAQSEILHDILSFVDDFDRALQEKEKEHLSAETKAFLDGFVMIHQSLYKFLEKNNVSEIKETKKFEPEIHEAISQIDSPDHESGDIIAVVQKGFMLKDKILRPAKVVVAK